MRVQSFAGLFMVISAISLTKTSQQFPVSLESRKMLRISECYSGIGFFVISLAFIIRTAVFSKPMEGVTPEYNGTVTAMLERFLR